LLVADALQPQVPAERHAVVIGGGIAGMAAARVLADHFERVTVVDRDHFPETARQRKGVPQARHIHVLLARGQRILFELFPQLEATLVAAGAVRLDWVGDALIYGVAGYVPRFPSGLVGYGATRDLLEHAVRACLARVPRVHLLEGYDVLGLVPERGGASAGGPPAGRVVGVRVRERGADGRQETLAAALTVDASGRESRAGQWLAELGYPPAEETVINSFYGYASALFRPPPGAEQPWKVLLARGVAPQTRGAVMLAVEGGLWQVTLAGAAYDYPPTDAEGFMRFAQTLPVPEIAEVLRACEAVTPIAGYRRMENRLRHYERLPGWPEGFAALGDAVCTFNPVYGQGMTAAAIGALVLDGSLRDAKRRGLILAAVTGRFQQALARSFRTPWLMATSEDYRYPETEGGRRDWSTRLAHWYFDRVLVCAAARPDIHLAFMETTHLLKPPTVLLRPSIAWRVLTRGLPAATH
jgi:2-polyprenyl-6-methoxyphenol hydroxylase-like FAD-dependent oxidoreductase